MNQALPTRLLGAGEGLSRAIDGAHGLSLREVVARMDAGEPPASAEEYLLRVRIEADRLPDVLRDETSAAVSDGLQSPVTLSIGTTKVEKPDESRSSPAPSDSSPLHQPPPQPSLSWQRRCYACFVECQQYMRRLKALRQAPRDDPSSRIPSISDATAWRVLTFGDPQKTGRKDRGARAPTISLLMSLDHRALLLLLSRHVSWLCQDAKQASAVSRLRSMWLYALMCCLEKPLLPDTAATLRKLARHLSQLRLGLPNATAAPELAPIDILLTLVELGFQQGSHLEELRRLG